MPQFNTDVTPDVTGRALGRVDQRYDAFLRNLNVSGTITGNFSSLAINRLSRQVIQWTAVILLNGTPVQGSSFEITLTGNLLGLTILNLAQGGLYLFLLRQDSTGNRFWFWPNNVFGGADIGLAPNDTTVQLFYSDGVNLYAITPGVIQ